MCGGGVRARTGSQLDLTELGFKNASAKGVFGDRGALSLHSEWELLMAQNEVVNWMRSSEAALKTMRYPGEFKFAGGNIEPGETPEQAARRELEEELLEPCGLALPASAVLRPFCVKQTRPIRGRSNMVYNFVLLEPENPWVAELLEPTRINRKLADRRVAFQSRLSAGGFWDLPNRAKESVAPEVREVRWVSLRDAIFFMLSSMAQSEVIYVNQWQREAFAEYGLRRRDPMFITGATLMELEAFPTVASIVAFSKHQDVAELAEAEQWLFDGMSQAEVDEVFAARARASGINPSFKRPDHIEKLRAERLAADGPAKL